MNQKVQFDQKRLLIVMIPIALGCVGLYKVANLLCTEGSWCGTIKMVAFLGPLYGALWIVGWAAKTGRWPWIVDNDAADAQTVKRKPSKLLMWAAPTMIIAGFLYMNWMGSDLPSSEIVEARTRVYLEQTYGHASSEWQIQSKGWLREYKYDPPKLSYEIEYSYNDKAGYLRVDCTDFETSNKLLFEEIEEDELSNP